MFRRGSADAPKCPVKEKHVTRPRLIALLLIALAAVAAVLWIVDRSAAGRSLLVTYWPLVLGCLVVVASMLEIAWWLRLHPWYYRTGPRICAERWQTAGTSDQLREAIRPALNTEAWVGREATEGFFLRRKSLWHFGVRVLLRLEDSDQGTAVIYEVRPIIVAPLWLLFAGLLIALWFRGSLFFPLLSWLVIIPCLVFVTAHAMSYYHWLAPREANRMARVRHVRRALAAYRLGVCEECGYDLFGHSGTSVCPECGREVEPA